MALQGTGLALTPRIQARLRGDARYQSGSAPSPSHEIPRQLQRAAEEDIESGGDTSGVATQGNSRRSAVVSKSADANDSGSQVKDQSAKAKKGPEGRKKKRKKFASQLSFEEYLVSIFDPSEQVFFLALDSELERICDFFEKELADATARFTELVSQLRELAEHRRLYKESQVGDLADRLPWKNPVPLVAKVMPTKWSLAQSSALGGSGNKNALEGQNALSNAPVQSMRRRRPGEDAQDLTLVDCPEQNGAAPPSRQIPRASEDAGAKRRSEALEHMQELAQAKAATDDRERVAAGTTPAAGLSYDAVRYKTARHKLKEAIAEFYRGLELIRSFQVLNKDGFGKILKKFDKVLGTETSHLYWKAKVQPSAIVRSQRIEALLRSTEDAFAGFFEHGDRKKALDRLRSQGHVTNTLRTHHGSTSRSGFFLGISLCAVVGGLTEAMKPEKQAEIPSWQALLRVYGALFLPVFFSILFGINLLVFARARISTLFIFEWDPRTALDFHQYFELPSLFFLLLSVAFWISFVNPFPQAIAPTSWPLIWLVVILTILLIPLPILHHRSRLWFVRSMLRVFGFGFLVKGTVEFRDFFLGDELNSIAWSISNLWFIGCEYQREWQSPQCSPNDTYWTAILSSLPALLRLGQCLRRFADSKFYARVHLLNGLKYSTAVLFYFFYIHWRQNGSQRNGDLALWIYFACMYSSFSMAWDILMDWSLLHSNARFPLLRNELVFESVWPIYYFAIISNVILRCSWIIYLLPGSASLTTRTFIVAFLEVLRRFQWNFFRVANEHSSNVDQYRALRDTPLPYYIPKPSEEEAEERSSLTGKWRVWKRKQESMDIERTSLSIPTGVELPAPPPTAATATSTVEGMSTAPASAGLRDTVLNRFQTFLVPDRGGYSAKGRRLDDQSAAKGAMGRDYAPRAQEADADSGDEDEDEDTAPSSETDGEAPADTRAGNSKVNAGPSVSRHT